MGAPSGSQCPWHPQHRGQDAQGDISGKTAAVDRTVLPPDLPVVPELLGGAVAQCGSTSKIPPARPPPSTGTEGNMLLNTLQGEKKIAKSTNGFKAV